MVVKETRFRHHPVRVEKSLYLGSQQLDILGYRADLQSAVLENATDVSSTSPPWVELTLGDLITVPDDAIAIILDVEVNDSNSDNTQCYMAFCPTGSFITEGKISYVYCANVDDRKFSRVVIVELTTRDSIHYKIIADTNFDWALRILGWLIGGTDLSKITPPAVELFCKVIISE